MTYKMWFHGSYLLSGLGGRSSVSFDSRNAAEVNTIANMIQFTQALGSFSELPRATSQLLT